jgi:hypothetical protein
MLDQEGAGDRSGTCTPDPARRGHLRPDDPSRRGDHRRQQLPRRRSSYSPRRTSRSSSAATDRGGLRDTSGTQRSAETAGVDADALDFGLTRSCPARTDTRRHPTTYLAEVQVPSSAASASLGFRSTCLKSRRRGRRRWSERRVNDHRRRRERAGKELQCQ